MRPMTAGTSLSEAALGRPSLLQAAVCYPGTSTDTPAHGAQHPAPVYQHPAPSTRIHHAHSQHRRPVSTTRTASSQHRRRCLYHAHCQRPAPAPCLHRAHSQLTAPSTSTTARTSTRHRHPARAPCMFPPRGQDQRPAPAPSTGTLSRKRAQPAHCHNKSSLQAHSQHAAPAPGTGAGTLSPPRAQPAPSTSTGTLSPRAPPAHSTSAGTRHPAPAPWVHHAHSQRPAPAPGSHPVSTLKNILGKSWGRGGSCQEPLRIGFIGVIGFSRIYDLFECFFIFCVISMLFMCHYPKNLSALAYNLSLDTGFQNAGPMACPSV